jgi:tRNA(His) 5'-end guanylyltransferase
MVETTKKLVEHTVANCGYTQSDEITLTWDINPWFDGRIFKMTSQLAAQATIFFFTSISELMPEYAKKMPTFDARVWSMPNKKEVTNVFLWRELDATKNSISMAAQSVYSHKELHKKNSSNKQDMLMAKNINWNDYPSSFKRGTYVRKRTSERKFTEEELLALPEKHEARKSPDLIVKRQYFSIENLPIFSTIQNKSGVIFDGEEACQLITGEK